MSERDLPAVGMIADASFVVVVSFPGSLVITSVIFEARKEALSLVRMTWIEEAIFWISEGSRGIYRV